MAVREIPVQYTIHINNNTQSTMTIVVGWVRIGKGTGIGNGFRLQININEFLTIKY